MLNKEECQKACLYLLKHCYETDAPALENGEEGKTYTFTPSGFKESEIFKQLIEEHFYPQPLKFEDLNWGTYVWDDKLKTVGHVGLPSVNRNEIYIEYIGYTPTKIFEENRFYPINIQQFEGEEKC